MKAARQPFHNPIGEGWRQFVQDANLNVGGLFQNTL
jgi:hypothetical protein